MSRRNRVDGADGTDRTDGIDARGERLQKILSRAAVASRRKSEELIEQGRVTVNGRTAVLGERADAEHDAIKVDGRRIRLAAPLRYVLLNKPTGYLSTTADPRGRPTVMDLVAPSLRRVLKPVGRLDYQTEGLLILSNDGAFAQRVSHPRHGCGKTYEVKVKGRPNERTIDKLRSGVVLDGRRTAPCRILARPGGKETASNTWWSVELREGRTRQIREMFQRAGHPVQRLRRLAIGPVRDPHLKPGESRELRPAEVEVLSGRRKTGRKKPRSTRSPAR